MEHDQGDELLQDSLTLLLQSLDQFRQLLQIQGIVPPSAQQVGRP